MTDSEEDVTGALGHRRQAGLVTGVRPGVGRSLRGPSAQPGGSTLTGSCGWRGGAAWCRRQECCEQGSGVRAEAENGKGQEEVSFASVSLSHSPDMGVTHSGNQGWRHKNIHFGHSRN